MRSNLAILVVSILLLTSCTNKLILHPLSGTDVYNGTNKGDLCFSSYYLDNVMQIKIDKSHP